MAFGEEWRGVAEKNIAQSRELYSQSVAALGALVASWVRSFRAAGQRTVALNLGFVDRAQRNINSGFDLAKDLAAAKSFTDNIAAHTSYWRKQLEPEAGFETKAGVQGAEVLAKSGPVASGATAKSTKASGAGQETARAGSRPAKPRSSSRSKFASTGTKKKNPGLKKRTASESGRTAVKKRPTVRTAASGRKPNPTRLDSTKARRK